MTDVQSKINLLDLDRTGMVEFFTGLGEKRFRAEQVMKWIYHRHVDDFEQMTDLGKVLRAKLVEQAEVRAPKTIFDKPSVDGTQKWLLGMDTGNAKPFLFLTKAAVRFAFQARWVAA